MKNYKFPKTPIFGNLVVFTLIIIVSSIIVLGLKIKNNKKVNLLTKRIQMRRMKLSN